MVLVGEGSDEVFGGYGDMAHMLNTRVAAAGSASAACRAWCAPACTKPAACCARPRAAPTSCAARATDKPLYWGLDVVFWDSEKAQPADAETRARMGENRRSQSGELVEKVYAELAARQPHADLLQKMSVIELNNRLPELLLMRVDKLSMAHSIEARAPFLDHATCVATGCRCRAR